MMSSPHKACGTRTKGVVEGAEAEAVAGMGAVEVVVVLSLSQHIAC